MKKPQVFFNKPQRSVGIDQIVSDIRNATTRISLVCAWFTDKDIAQEIINSKVKNKIIILSAADINRGETAATHMLRSASKNSPVFEFHIIGSKDFQEGIMHNKFIIADQIVWTGSYNFTYQARKNYETLIRFDDESISNKFQDEVIELSQEWVLWDGCTQFAITDGAFRCAMCEKLKPTSSMCDSDKKYGSSNALCATCDSISRSRNG